MALRTAITGQASAWTAALLAMLLVAPPETLAGELLEHRVGRASPRSEKVAAGARDGDGFTGFAFGPAIADRATMAFVLPGAPVEVGAAVNLHSPCSERDGLAGDGRYFALVDDRGGRLGWRVGLQPGPPVTLALPLGRDIAPPLGDAETGPPMPSNSAANAARARSPPAGRSTRGGFVDTDRVPIADSPQTCAWASCSSIRSATMNVRPMPAIVDAVTAGYVRGPWLSPRSGASASSSITTSGHQAGHRTSDTGQRPRMTPDRRQRPSTSSSRGSTPGSASAAALGHPRRRQRRRLVPDRAPRRE